MSNSLDLEKDLRFVQNVFDVYYKSGKQFGSRSGLTLCRLDLGSNRYQQTTKVVTSEGVGARSPVVTSRIIVIEMWICVRTSMRIYCQPRTCRKRAGNNMKCVCSCVIRCLCTSNHCHSDQCKYADLRHSDNV